MIVFDAVRTAEWMAPWHVNCCCIWQPGYEKPQLHPGTPNLAQQQHTSAIDGTFTVFSCNSQRTRSDMDGHVPRVERGPPVAAGATHRCPPQGHTRFSETNRYCQVLYARSIRGVTAPVQPRMEGLAQQVSLNTSLNPHFKGTIQQNTHHYLMSFLL